MYTWGAGDSGKLGHGNLEGQKTPKRVEFFVGRDGKRMAASKVRVTQIAAGKDHMMATTGIERHVAAVCVGMHQLRWMRWRGDTRETHDSCVPCALGQMKADSSHGGGEGMVSWAMETRMMCWSRRRWRGD